MRLCIGNIPVDIIKDEEEAIIKILDIIDKAKKPSFITTLNPEIAYKAETDRRVRKIVQSASLNLIDGIGIAKILQWKLGISPRRITGVDTTKNLLKRLPSSVPVYLFGAKEKVLSSITKKLKKENPQLNLIGYYHGYSNWDVVADDIERKRPKLLLVALGAGRQEKFMYYYVRHFSFPIVSIGVGGSFDVWSGMVERAPQTIQNIGLEWLWRNIKEPSRISRLFLSIIYMMVAIKKEVYYCEK